MVVGLVPGDIVLDGDGRRREGVRQFLQPVGAPAQRDGRSAEYR